MFFPEGHVRVFVYGEPVKMNLSYDGLYGLTKNRLGRDPLDGSLYAFINRRANQIKVLYFDRTGLCIWGMRLERGRFLRDWSTVRTREMDWTGLKLLLEGIEPRRVYKRYRHAMSRHAISSENGVQRSAA